MQFQNSNESAVEKNTKESPGAGTMFLAIGRLLIDLT